MSRTTGGRTPVLWYVHDQGSGHLARARAVLPHLRHRAVVATGPGIAATARRQLDTPVVELPTDVPTSPTATVGPWHHAPTGPAVRARSLSLVAAVAEHGCTVAVADVSMEVAVLARLCGLRVVAVRQSGERPDLAHRIGLSSADVVWVPQHRELEPLAGEAGDVDARWRFTGAFSRLDQIDATPRGRSDTRLAVVLLGAGGTSFDPRAWRSAAAPPGWRVVIAGGSERWCGREIACVGRVDDVGALLRDADLVIAASGWGAVADAASVGAPLVVVPEPRPFREQEVRAAALAAAGLAVVRDRWPEPVELDQLAAAADRLPAGRWSPFYDGCGAQRAAAIVDAEVDR